MQKDIFRKIHIEKHKQTNAHIQRHTYQEKHGLIHIDIHIASHTERKRDIYIYI